MVDLAYSNKLYKRIIFVTVCITMSFLLSVTMFPTQAIAKAKENIVYSIFSDNTSNKADLVENEDNESDQNNNDLSQNETSDEELQSEENSFNQSSDNYYLNEIKDGQTNNKDSELENNDFSYQDKDNDDFNNQNDVDDDPNAYDAISAYNAQLQNKETEDFRQNNDPEDFVGNNYKWHDDVNDLSQNKIENKSSKIESASESIFNNPDWKFRSRTEGQEEEGKSKQWWKTDEETKEEDIKSQEGGNGTENDPYLVGTRDKLLDLLQNSKIKEDAPKKNSYIKLIADIDMTNNEVVYNDDFEKAAILLPYSVFEGTLDGNGHCISCSNNSRVPFFYKLVNATIKNLTLSLSVRFVDFEFHSAHGMDILPNELGLLSSICEGSLVVSDCTFVGNLTNREDEVAYGEKKLGGIIGQVKGKTNGNGICFTNVKNQVNISCNGTALHNAGGFVGLAENDIKISFDNCVNEGTVTTLSATSAMANIAIELGKFIVSIIFGAFITKFYAGRNLRNIVSAAKASEAIAGEAVGEIEDLERLFAEIDHGVAPYMDEIPRPSDNLADYFVRKGLISKEFISKTNIEYYHPNCIWESSSKNAFHEFYDNPKITKHFNSDTTIDLNKIKPGMNRKLLAKDFDQVYKAWCNKSLRMLDIKHNQKSIYDLMTKGGKVTYGGKEINVLSFNEFARTKCNIVNYNFETCTCVELNDMVKDLWFRDQIGIDIPYYSLPGINTKHVSNDDSFPFDLEYRELDMNEKIKKINKGVEFIYCGATSKITDYCLQRGISDSDVLAIRNFLNSNENIDGIKINSESIISSEIAAWENGQHQFMKNFVDIDEFYPYDQQNPELTAINCNLFKYTMRYFTENDFYYKKIGKDLFVTREYMLTKDPEFAVFHYGNKTYNNQFEALQLLKFQNLKYIPYNSARMIPEKIKNTVQKVLKALQITLLTVASTFSPGIAVYRLSRKTGFQFYDSISPIMYFYSNASHRTFVNTQNQNVGKLKMNQSVKDAIRAMIKQMQNRKDKSSMDEDTKKALDEVELDDNNILYSDNIVNQCLYEFIGDLFIKRFNALTGNQQLYWNVFQDKNGSNEEVKHLEDTSDFVALQGRLIFDGLIPIANVMSDSTYEQFINSANVQYLIRDIKYYKYQELNREQLYNKYVELGKAYCLACANEDNGMKNMAYDQTLKFSYLAQNILQESCYSLYTQERNVTEDYYNEKLNEHKISHGSASIRNFMNENFTDSLNYLDFLVDWGPKLENKFIEKAINADIWEGDNKDLDINNKKQLLKHFFITYLTYTGEFSYYNYLPLMRGILLCKDQNMYRTDFLYTNEEIKSNKCSNYIYSDETWKFTSKKPAIEIPIPVSVIQECAFYSDKEAIDELLKFEYNEDDFVSYINNTDTDFAQQEMNKLSENTGGGIFASFDDAFKALQEIASNIPRYDQSVFYAHFRAYAGGFIGYAEKTQVSFKDCQNTASITGGDYAGGFIGAINSSNSKATFDKCINGGTVVCGDETDHSPTVGGYIGDVKDDGIRIDITNSLNTGVLASRKIAGGFIGTAGGTITIENCSCSGGIAAPRYCGGYIGKSDDGDVKSITIDNCYSYCVFDGASNADKTIDYHTFIFSFVGIYIPSFEINTTRNELNLEEPGALSGDWSDKIRVKNYFYLQGNDLIGRGKEDKAKESVKNECHACSSDEFVNGSIGYKLNEASLRKDPSKTLETAAFGQCIDDFRNFEKSNLPLPGFEMPIYMDRISEESIYTNYDPRYADLKKVKFDYKNAIISPDISEINVNSGTNLKFNVKAKESYKISKIWYEQAADQDGSDIQKYDLHLNEGDNSFGTYTLKKIEKNILVHIETSENELTCPKGSGLDFDPYLISTREELLWLNKTLKQNMFTNVHVKLINNIDMAGSKWSPLFSQREGMGFNGTFDGNGYTIDNISIDSDGAESGAFFNGVEGGNIGGVFIANSSYDDTLENFLKNSDKKIAVPADCYDLLYYILSRFRGYEIDHRLIKYFQENNKSPENICLESLKSGKDDVGICYFNFNQNLISRDFKVLDTSGGHGIVKNLTLNGQFNDAVFAKSARNAKFEKCISRGSVSGTGKSCGGIVAIATKNVQFTECENLAVINYNAADSYYPGCGGIVGTFTSMKYVYADASTTEKVNYDSGINYLDAEIINCKNYAPISASSTFAKEEWGLDVGGIVGNITEYDIKYDIAAEYDKIDKNNSNSYKLKAAYVLIKECRNYASIGDSENTYSCRCGGILGAVGYLNCEQDSYKCDIISCENSGNIGFDTGGFETGVKVSGGICGFSNSMNKENASTKTYKIDNAFTPITSNFESIQCTASRIYNCINYGKIRAMTEDNRKSQYQGGQILGTSKRYHPIIANCLAADIFSKVIGDEGYKFSLNNIYCNEQLVLHNKAGIIWYKDSDLKTGKVAYDLMQVDNNLVDNFLPNIGQNIDVVRSNGQSYTRQFEPHVLDEKTQKVYKTNKGDAYSEYSGDKKLYTNVVTEASDLNKDNSYKVKIKIEDDNGATDNKNICKIDGYVKVKKDAIGNANFEYNIVGLKGYTLSSLSFGNHNIDITNSSIYSFRVSQMNDKFVLNNNSSSILKSYDSGDSYTCFDLIVKFSQEKKPAFVNGYYNINDKWELKWYSNHFNDVDTCKKDAESPTGVWNALLTKNIYIENDDDFEPIGTINNKYNGKFLGSLYGSENKTIINNSSKPIFGVLGTNAEIKNCVVSANYTITKIEQLTWTAALADKAIGENIKIEDIDINGSIDSTAVMNELKSNYKVDFNYSAAAFISKIESDNSGEENIARPNSVYIKNSSNNLKIILLACNIGGFVGFSKNSRLYISNCENKYTSLNGSCFDFCNTGGAIGKVIDNLDLQMYFNDGPNVNINSFTNCSNNNDLIKPKEKPEETVFDIPAETDQKRKNMFGSGGVIGNYTVCSSGNYQTEDIKQSLLLTKCVNTGSQYNFGSAGGLVGCCMYDDVISKQFSYNGKINIDTCENRDVNIASLGFASGGLIGSVFDDHEIKFHKCLSSADIYKNFKGGKEIYIGGLIGFTNTSIKIYLDTVSSKMESLAEKHSDNYRIGYLFGEHSKYNANNLICNNIYYMRAKDIEPPIGYKRVIFSLIFNKDLKKPEWEYSMDDYKSGKVAYHMNQNCEEDNELQNNDDSKDKEDKPWIIGQDIDKVEINNNYPSFSGAKVYNPKENTYTNFDNRELSKKYIVRIHPDDNTKWKGVDCAYNFNIDDDAINIPIKEVQDKLILDKLIINDKHISNSDDSKDISFYQIWKDYPSIFKNDKFDLKLLNSALPNVIKPGFNDITYNYSATREPLTLSLKDKDWKSSNDCMRDSYLITCAHEFKWIADKMQEQKLDDNKRVISIENDIDMRYISWDEAIKWNGCSIWGNGHKIYNVCGSASAFISVTTNAYFGNFELNVDFKTKSANSAFIAHAKNNTIIEDVTVSGSIISSGSCELFGGIVGDTSGGLCSYVDASKSDDLSIKLLLPHIPYYNEAYDYTLSGNVVKNCTNKLSKISWSKYNYRAISSGIVGHALCDDKWDRGGVYIDNCVNYAEICSTNGFSSNEKDDPDRSIAAGILGKGWKSGSKISIYNCENKANITGFFAGGIFGLSGLSSDNKRPDEVGKLINIRYCDNNGNIKGRISGGILGTSFCTCYVSDNYMAIDACTNKADVFCPVTGRDHYWNIAGGIVGLITDDDLDNGDGYTGWIGEDTILKVTINHCANVGCINSNAKTSAGGIVGEVSRCDKLWIANSYSIDRVYNNDNNKKRHSILGWTAEYANQHYARCRVYLDNVYDVGDRNIGTHFRGDDDEYYYALPTGDTDVIGAVYCWNSGTISYSRMLSGQLCYSLNTKNHTLKDNPGTKDDAFQENWGWDSLKKAEFGMSGPSFGQTIDNLDNLNNCAKLYPVPNHYSDSTVYPVGSSWKSSNTNDGLNFASYTDSLVDKACYQDKSFKTSVHNKLFSNFSTNNGVQNGVHVNVWNKYYNNGKLYNKKINDAGGSIVLLDKTGEPIEDIKFISLNGSCLRAMANDYSCYYSRDNGIDKYRDFTIVCKPRDGYVISWIAVDGVIRNKNDYNYSGHVGIFDCDYNMIKTSELEQGVSHTIDVGFSATSQPKIVDDVYQISNYPELLWFSNHVNGGDYTAKAALVGNIEASCSSANGGWVPIGTESNPFEGSFDGNNYVISGLSKSSDDENVAFIANARSARVLNLRLENFNFTATGKKGANKDERAVAGLIAKGKYVDVRQVYVKGIIQSAGNRMGGLIGYLYNSDDSVGISKISDCTSLVNSNAAIAKTGHVGGIIGMIDEATWTNIDRCINYSNIQSNTYPTGASNFHTDYAGGIVGYGEAKNGTLLNITNCINRGTIHGDSSGGIIGDFHDSGSISNRKYKNSRLCIQGCTNLGNISGDYCGGIIGIISNVDVYADYYTIDWCNNFGSIGTANYRIKNAGGIIGELFDIDVKLNLNYDQNFGMVYAGGGYSTGTSQHEALNIDTKIELLGIGLATFAEFAWGAFSGGPHAALVVCGILLAYTAVEFITRTIMNYAVNARTMIDCDAGGIIGNIRHVGKLTMSNIMNYGVTSAADRSNGICGHIQKLSDIKHINNVYSVQSHANSDNSHKDDSSKFTYLPFKSFKDGTVAMKIENSKTAGLSYIRDDECNDTKIGISSEDTKVSKVVKRIYGYEPQIYYYGQNIDIYGDELGISAIPNYMYNSSKYTVWKAPDDMIDIDDMSQKSKIRSGRSFHTNYRNLASITLRDFGHLHIKGKKLSAVQSNDVQFEDNDLQKNSDSNVDFNDNVINKDSSSNLKEVSLNMINASQFTNEDDNNNEESDDNNSSDDAVDNNEESDIKDEEKIIFNLSEKESLKLRDFFDFDVTGGSSIGKIPSMYDVDKDDKKNTGDNFEKDFQMFHKESVNAKISPKKMTDQKYSIKRVDMPSSGETGSKYYISIDNKWVETDALKAMSQEAYLRKDFVKCRNVYDDGKIEDLYNPSYLVKKGESNELLMASDYKVIYYLDGSIEIIVYQGIEEKQILDVDVVVSDKPVHKHEVPDTGKVMRFISWDGSFDGTSNIENDSSKANYMPNLPSAYYLENDIVLDKTWVVPAGKFYLCLNGHDIILKNGAYIDVSTNNSNLQICDNNHGNNSVSRTYNEDNDSNLKFWDSTDKYDEKRINGGSIYVISEGDFSVCNTMFNVGKNSTLGLHDINVFQHNKTKSVVNINNTGNDKYSVTLNANILESKNSRDDANNRIVQFGNTQNELDYDQLINSSITFGDKYKHFSTSGNDKPNVNSDIYTNSTNTSLNIKFSDNYKFEQPIAIDVDSTQYIENACLNLTTDFEKFIEKGIVYNRVFSLKRNNNMTIALTSLEDIKNREKLESDDNVIGKDVDKIYKAPEETYNNICVCNKDIIQEIEFDVQGPGNIYPNTKSNENEIINLVYKKGSKAKFTYYSNELTFLNQFIVYKTCLDKCTTTLANANEELLYSANKTLYYSENVDKKLNGKGTIIVDCLDRLQKDKEYYDEDGHKCVIPQYDVDCTTKFFADFSCTKDVDINNGRWNLWNNTKKLPFVEDIINAQYDGGEVNFNNIHYFRLDCDVFLQNVWTVPKTKVVIDLNGHVITYNNNYEVMSNNNLIILNDSSTLLSIYDSSKLRNDAPKRNYKKNEDGNWVQVESVKEDDKDVCVVVGGLIYGGHVTTRNYHKTQDSAGAIVAKQGVLNFIGGNMCMNYSEGCLGGAAITVKEKASCYIYSDATISNNELYGDPSYYNTRMFAAGVASEGYLYNEGKIINNSTNNCAASAVYINKGNFDNKGEISNNICKILTGNDIPEKYNNPFGAVCINVDCQLNNTGSIVGNTANFNCPALRCLGTLTISGKSQIFNNYWKEDKKDIKEEEKKEEKKHQLDISISEPIKIEGQLEYVDGQQSVLSKNNIGTIIVNDWDTVILSNKGITSDKIFKIYNNDTEKDKGDSNMPVLAVGNNKASHKNELKISTISRVCRVDTLYYMEGQKEKMPITPDFCNLYSDERYICGEDINVVIAPSRTLKVTSIKIGDEDLNVSAEHINKFTHNFKGWGDKKDSQDMCVLPMIITLKTFDPDSEAKRKKEYDEKFIDFDGSDYLPEKNGYYKLLRDVKLDAAWHPASGETVIDLNGYSITTNKENENVIYVDNADTTLTITDTSLFFGTTRVHYLAKKDHGYELINDTTSINEKVTVKGGFIGNAHFNNVSSSYNKSGAIYVDKGNFKFEAGSVIANSINNVVKAENGHIDDGQGASAIYIGKEAKATLGDKDYGHLVNISYNYSTCMNNQYRYGAAGLEIRGWCESYATISNNIAESNSVAGAAVITQGSKFYNKGRIVNNIAKKYSVAGLLVCSDEENTESKTNSNTENVCFATNIGEISGNVASEHSIAAVELYGKLLNTGEGKIIKNKSYDGDSYAGIYSCGNLILDQSSQICQNIYEPTNENAVYQDIVFDEDDYGPYTVNPNNPQNVTALFTFGKDYNPSISTYSHGKSDGAKPYSLTHVSVNNYDSKSGKTLLLATGFLSNKFPERTIRDINSYFEVMDPNYDISATNDGNIYYGYTNDNAYLHVSSNDWGTVTCLGDTVTPKIVKTELKIKAVPMIGHHVESVVINNQISLPIKNNKDFEFTYSNQDADIVIGGKTVIDVKFALDYGSIDRKNVASNWQEWKYNTTLPSTAGCYILTCDVCLLSTWCVPKVSPLILNLNGHNITISNDEPVMRLNEKDTSLDIIDSCTTDSVKARFSKDNNGKFVKNQNGSIVYKSGCIYGGKASKGGAIYISESTYLSARNINIVGNEATLQGGAVYNEGDFVAGQNTTIAGNISESGGGVFNTNKGVTQIDGTIKNNISTKNAGGVFADGIFQLCEHAIIGDNSLIEKKQDDKDATRRSVALINSDIVLKEYNDEKSTGSIIKVFPSSNNSMSNNGNLYSYVSCISTDESANLMHFRIPTLQELPFPDSGLYVVKADGVYTYELDPQNKVKYIPSKNPIILPENKPSLR